MSKNTYIYPNMSKNIFICNFYVWINNIIIDCKIFYYKVKNK